jgi:nitrate reductase NapE component
LTCGQLADNEQANKKEAKKKKERAKMRLRRMSMGLWPIVAVAAGDRVGWASPRQAFEKKQLLTKTTIDLSN